MNKKIICCGNIAFDLIIKGKDPSGNMELRTRLGGSICNTSVLLTKLGLPVYFISRTGDDFLSHNLIEILRKNGVVTRHIIRDKNIKTSLAFAQIDKKGDPSYVFYKTGAPSGTFRKKQFPYSLLDSTSIFHTGSIFSYEEGVAEELLIYVKKASAKKVFVSYDPNWRGYRIKNKKDARSRIRALLPYIDLLKMSREDALGITGKSRLPEALNKISDSLKGAIIVTDSAKGSFYWDGARKISHPSFKVKVTDTIGAGDAFTAGLLFRYIKKGAQRFQDEKKENLRFASAVASLVCTGKGATEGLKSIDQVEAFLEKH